MYSSFYLLWGALVSPGGGTAEHPYPCPYGTMLNKTLLLISPVLACVINENASDSSVYISGLDLPVPGPVFSP